MSTARAFCILTIGCFLASLTGCGIVHDTLPARAAMEQLIISTAADRAVAELPTEGFADRDVFLDGTNLDAYDKPYVVQAIRRAIISAGGRMAADRAASQVVLEVASGGLSLNKRDYLLGVPSIALAGTGTDAFRTPELPIFKMLFYRGKAKLIFCAVDPTTGAQLFELPTCYGKSTTNFWWLLLFGPNQWSDLPEELD